MQAGECMGTRRPRFPGTAQEGLEEKMTVEPRALRDAMGCFATAVTVVTTIAEGRAIGVTVNSFNSVSLDPPLVLFSLAHDATALQAIRDSGHFAVNVLRDDQQALSQRFATSGVDALGDLPVRRGVTGSALIEGAIAHFDCHLEDAREAGDHTLLIGRVAAVAHSEGGDPLMYYRGRYAAVSPAGEA